MITSFRCKYPFQEKKKLGESFISTVHSFMVTHRNIYWVIIKQQKISITATLRIELYTYFSHSFRFISQLYRRHSQFRKFLMSFSSSRITQNWILMENSCIKRILEISELCVPGYYTFKIIITKSQVFIVLQWVFLPAFTESCKPTANFMATTMSERRKRMAFMKVKRFDISGSFLHFVLYGWFINHRIY